MAAIRQTTSAELPATAALMRIRGAVLRQDSSKAPATRRISILDELTAPGSVKVAVNLRVDDAGDGWSLVTTDTRILGTDDAGRRTMARYWRLIVPGSGLIRRQWLDAIRNRVEGRYTAPAA